MAFHLCVVVLSMLGAFVFGLLISTQTSLASAEFFSQASIASVGVFCAAVCLTPVFPWARNRLLLLEWGTTQTRRLRRLLLPLPVIWVAGAVVFVAISANSGAFPMGDAVIVAGIGIALLIAYAVAGPRFLIPKEDSPFWHVRRFDLDAKAFLQRVGALAEGASFVISTSAAGVLTISLQGDAVAVVIPQRKGGVFARVREGSSAQALKRLIADAAERPV